MNNNKIVSEMLDMILKEHVYDILGRQILNFNPPPEYAASDSIGEVLEKLAILHIRTWHLEDAMQAAKSDEELADLKRKVDICFKVKRPKLVAALNAMIDDAIVHNKSLREESVKLYKGVKEK
jgi:hypothetical protein